MDLEHKAQHLEKRARLKELKERLDSVSTKAAMLEHEKQEKRVARSKKKQSVLRGFTSYWKRTTSDGVWKLFKEAKQYLQLGKCQCNSLDSQIGATTLSMMQYIMLILYKQMRTLFELRIDSPRNLLPLD